MNEAMKRVKTKHIGVYFRNVARLGGQGLEKCFYITFKKDNRMQEEKAGRLYAERMTEGKAACIRAERIEGRRKSRREIREAKKVEDSRWTIDRLWTAYRESLESRPDKSRKGISVDGNRYDNFIKDRLGSKEPREVQHLDIERLRRDLQKPRCTLIGHPESTRTLSPATIRATLTLLERIANYGLRNGLCAGLSCKITMPKVSTIPTEDLNEQQLEALLAAIAADTNADARGIMLMALYTGMRRGELFKLKWQDVDFDRGFIRIMGPKGGQDQTIPLNVAARRVLEAHPRTCEYVFPGEDGGQRVTIQKALRRIRKAAGLSANFRPLHGLRHAFASRLASSGLVDMYTLQKLLTHKSPMMTQRYAHLRDEALRKASELAGSLIDRV
jgi:integrase